MPSYSNPAYFIPDANTAFAASLMDGASAAGSGGFNPFSASDKALQAADQYLKITVPLRIRSGANTITKGGYKEFSDQEWHDKGWLQQEWYDNYSPKALGKLRSATVHSFDPTNANPWNMLFWDQGGRDMRFWRPKKFLRKTGTRGELGGFMGMGKRAQSGLRSLASVDGALNPDHWVMKSGLLTKSGELAHWWDPRMMSRISASADWEKMDTLSARQVGNLGEYLRVGGNERLAQGLGKTAEWGMKVSGEQAAMMTRLGVAGAFSGRGMGVWEALRGTDVVGNLANLGLSVDSLGDSARAGLNWGNTVRDWAVDSEGTKLSYGDILGGRAAAAAQGAADSFAEAAGSDIAKKLASRLAITAAEGAGALSEAGLNPVLDVLAIASLAELGLDIGHYAASAVAGSLKNAANSFVGNVNKAPFGMGFHDTAASATARQRGLQAIASSRINARSVLGNEANSLYAHFQAGY